MFVNMGIFLLAQSFFLHICWIFVVAISACNLGLLNPHMHHYLTPRDKAFHLELCFVITWIATAKIVNTHFVHYTSKFVKVVYLVNITRTFIHLLKTN